MYANRCPPVIITTSLYGPALKSEHSTGLWCDSGQCISYTAITSYRTGVLETVLTFGNCPTAARGQVLGQRNGLRRAQSRRRQPNRPQSLNQAWSQILVRQGQNQPTYIIVRVWIFLRLFHVSSVRHMSKFSDCVLRLSMHHVSLCLFVSVFAVV